MPSHLVLVLRETWGQISVGWAGQPERARGSTGNRPCLFLKREGCWLAMCAVTYRAWTTWGAHCKGNCGLLAPGSCWGWPRKSESSGVHGKADASVGADDPAIAIE